MARRKIAVIPGDGIGPEVISEAVRVIKALKPDLLVETFDLGADRFLRDGTTMPGELMHRFKVGEFDTILLGAVGDPRVPDNRHAVDILMGCRKGLDLYVNMRPIRGLDDRCCRIKNTPAQNINITLFRENTEGEYSDMGGTLRRGTDQHIATEVTVATYFGARRIIDYAFRWALDNGRQRICLATKSNAMPETGGVWRRAFDDVSNKYAGNGLSPSHLFVDAMATKMILEPESFDVIVTSNLFGDILSDLGAGIIGGLGLAPSGNIRPGGIGLFEPVHGSAPDITGRGIANPIGAILSVGMMFSHLGHPELQERIEAAVRACLSEGIVTPDLGGEWKTEQVASSILENLQSNESFRGGVS